MMDYLPPSELPNNNYPVVLITTERALCKTRFMDLTQTELDEFVSKVSEIDGDEVEDPVKSFLSDLVHIDVDTSQSWTTACDSDSLRLSILNDVRSLKERYRASGRELLRKVGNYGTIRNMKGTSNTASNPASRHAPGTSKSGQQVGGPPATRPPEVLDIHRFFRSRRRAEAFWDKTLILCTEKTAAEYIQAYGHLYNAIVPVDCFNLSDLRISLLDIGSDVGLDWHEDYRLVDPDFAKQVYEEIEKCFQDNVLFVFNCPVLQDAYEDISAVLDYLPVHGATMSGGVPYTLILCLPFCDTTPGIIEQPSTASKDFLPDTLPEPPASLEEDDDDEDAEEVVGTPYRKYQAFPLAKVLFNSRLWCVGEEDQHSIFQTEMNKIGEQFEKQAGDYDCEQAIEQLGLITEDPKDAIIWMRLMTQMSSVSHGQEALTFLRGISLLPEKLVSNASSPATPSAAANAYSVELQLYLVGPEFESNLKKKLSILRKHSFLRYFISADGKVTLMVHKLVWNLAQLPPCDLPKSQVYTTLLSLAKIGQVHLSIQQMLTLQSEMNSVAQYGYALLSQINLESVNTDPHFQTCWPSLRDKLDGEIRRSSASFGGGSKVVTIENSFNSVRTDVIGIQAESVHASEKASLVVSVSGARNSLTCHTTEDGTAVVNVDTTGPTILAPESPCKKRRLSVSSAPSSATSALLVSLLTKNDPQKICLALFIGFLIHYSRAFQLRQRTPRGTFARAVLKITQFAQGLQKKDPPRQIIRVEQCLIFGHRQ